MVREITGPHGDRPDSIPSDAAGGVMKKGELKTTRWDVVDYLKTDEDMAEYLEAAIEDGHPAVIATAIGNIARAKGMTQVARKAGIGRVSLYKALSPNGNPEFATVLKVLKALGIRLHVTT
jgi:probable addiction module antidote protein